MVFGRPGVPSQTKLKCQGTFLLFWHGRIRRQCKTTECHRTSFCLASACQASKEPFGTTNQYGVPLDLIGPEHAQLGQTLVRIVISQRYAVMFVWPSGFCEAWGTKSKNKFVQERLCCLCFGLGPPGLQQIIWHKKSLRGTSRSHWP